MKKTSQTEMNRSSDMNKMKMNCAVIIKGVMKAKHQAKVDHKVMKTRHKNIRHQMKDKGIQGLGEQMQVRV